MTLGTVSQFLDANPTVRIDLPELTADGYHINVSGGNVRILGQNERGALDGALPLPSARGVGQRVGLLARVEPRGTRVVGQPVG